MDAWVDGWMDAWVDGWMDGWMDEKGGQQEVPTHSSELLGVSRTEEAVVFEIALRALALVFVDQHLGTGMSSAHGGNG